MTKNNQTSFIAKPGKQEIIITRIFDAPGILFLKFLMIQNKFHIGGDKEI